MDPQRMSLAPWRKSSYSNGRRGECVEAATGARFAALRDSKYPHRGALSFSSREWQAFVEAVKGEQL